MVEVFLKKLNIILDETTIINFPFIWKLMKRYYFITLLTPLISVFLGSYFFMIQNDIYMTTNTFKYVSDDASSPTDVIAHLLGERTAKLNPGEIIGLVKSEDFHYKLAEKLYKHKDFKKFNFNSLYAKNTKTHEEYFLSCVGNKSCIIDKIRGALSAFYFIVQRELVRTQYDLKIKTLDKLTSEILLDEVKNLIIENRIEDTKHFMLEQIKISERLIKTKKENMKNISMNDFNERIVSVSKELEDQSSQIRQYHNFYNTIKGRLYTVEERLIETKNTIRRGVSSKKMAEYKQRTKFQKDLRNVEKNIEELESVGGTITQSERYILRELNKQKESLKNKIKKVTSTKSPRTVNLISNFIKQKARGTDTDEYNYKVSKRQFKKIDRDYRILVKKRKKLEKELSFFQGKLEEMRPSFEYLKLLEHKLIQLKLVESTVVSDFIFDDFNPSFTRYKRTSEGKISIFATVLAIFLLLTSIIVRYIFDPRIYDEYELAKNFSELKIIGNTPDFN